MTVSIQLFSSKTDEKKKYLYIAKNDNILFTNRPLALTGRSWSDRKKKHFRDIKCKNTSKSIICVYVIYTYYADIKQILESEI